MDAFSAAVGVALFGAGVVIGLMLDYFAYTRPTLKREQRLIGMIYRMRKRGFVPQFDFEQAKTIDPSESIRER